MSSAAYLSAVRGMVRTAPGAIAALLLLCPRCATNRARKMKEGPHD